uniref:Zinc knuckle CX2CX4HX4C domain-containing protein n=1 Tax=Kalanchoe fedtschenkoi TaxID=63787 RepID=A0A7N0UWZ5_KALFE
MEIRAHIIRRLKVKGPVTTGSLDDRHELIILNSMEDTVEDMARGVHQIGRFLLRLFRWTNFNSKNEYNKRIASVRIPHLNIPYFNEGFLRPIGDKIGTYLKDDDRSIELTCPAYARMLVEIDLKKPLLRLEIYIGSTTGEGEYFEEIYEGKLAYCSKCKMQSYNMMECRKIKPQVAVAKAANTQVDPEKKWEEKGRYVTMRQKKSSANRFQALQTNSDVDVDKVEEEDIRKCNEKSSNQFIDVQPEEDRGDISQFQQDEDWRLKEADQMQKFEEDTMPETGHTQPTAKKKARKKGSKKIRGVPATRRSSRTLSKIR